MEKRAGFPSAAPRRAAGGAGRSQPPSEDPSMSGTGQHPLELGTSTSLTRWGDHQAGDVAPPDLSWGPMPACTPASKAEEHVPHVGREQTRRWWCRGEVGEPLHKGDAGGEGPCKNAHRDSGKQSGRRNEGGRLGHLLHGGGDHPLLWLQGVLIGVLALFGPEFSC